MSNSTSKSPTEPPSSSENQLEPKNQSVPVSEPVPMQPESGPDPKPVTEYAFGHGRFVKGKVYTRKLVVPEPK